MRYFTQILFFILFTTGCNFFNEVEILKISKTKAIWKECEERKYIPGAEHCTYIRLLTHINRQFKYPSLAKENGIEGDIKAEFHIDKNGKVDTINLLSNLGFGCDEEAVRVLKTIPDFIPATQNGEFVSSKDTLTLSFNGGRNLISPIYKIGDISPSFKNCQSASSKKESKDCNKKEVKRYFLSHFKYPKQAKREKIQGHVQINFVIEKDGSIGHPYIARDIGYGCGEEALRIVKMMPKWTPAVYRGRNVRHIWQEVFEFKLGYFDTLF